MLGALRSPKPLRSSEDDGIGPAQSGQRRPECPSCHEVLPRVPKTKTTCAHCGEFIFVRTRARDNARVVVTAQEAERIEQDWRLLAGAPEPALVYLANEAEVEAERDKLKHECLTKGLPGPSDDDVKWRLLVITATGARKTMSVPDYISPIVGYRVWTWNTKGLKSLCGGRWHPGQSLAARCRASAVVGPIVGRSEAADDHDAPQSNCTCGIYAVKTLHHFRGAGYEQFGIYGEVYLWGTVVEHELGWRAQFAYPRTCICRPIRCRSRSRRFCLGSKL